MGWSVEILSEVLCYTERIKISICDWFDIPFAAVILQDKEEYQRFIDALREKAALVGWEE